MTDGGRVRIQKALADAGIASRRRADELVAAGRVSINGRRAAVGESVDPAADRIALDGRPLAAPPSRVYLAMGKPPGVTSTVSDRHAHRTVLELVPPDVNAAAGRLYPVGRLDRDSEGLLLLTNDGDWAQRLLHPRYGVPREYAVAVATPLTDEQVRRLQDGIALEEGMAAFSALRPATPAEHRWLDDWGQRPADRVPAARARSWYVVELRQGWKRQVRRMFSTVGAPVERLVRTRIGGLRLGALRPGQVREISARERAALEGSALGATASGRARGA